jgi:anaerobic magnesium-protoporphyrin IX monomethyl ester cyclase
MRVLLISSFTFSDVNRIDIAPPLSLLYIAAALRAHGHEPLLLDLTPLKVPPEANREEFYVQIIMNKIANVKPDLVGQNCFMSSHFAFVRNVARSVKTAYPSLPFAIGGIHPTLFAQEIVSHCPEIDYVIMGEGERQAVMLADALQTGSAEAMAAIPSLAYRNASGAAELTPRLHYEEDLDALPMPAWDMVTVEDYYTDHSKWYNPRNLDIKMSVPIMTSRACPFNCNFCSAHVMMGRKLRLHSATRVVDEMQRLYQAYGLNYFGFVDDNLTLQKRHVLSICNEIVKRGLIIQFESFNGYNIASMDEEIVAAMCAAGCVYVIMPIEHGSDHIRNTIIGKRLPREKIYAMADIYKKYNLLTRGVFIMGFPEDTKETLDDTYHMMLDLKLDLYNVFTLIPFPGTRVFDQAMRDGLFLDEIHKESLWDGTLELNAVHQKVFLKPYKLSIEELIEYRNKFDEMRIFSARAKQLQERKA